MTEWAEACHGITYPIPQQAMPDRSLTLEFGVLEKEVGYIGLLS
jgi:hypothetical protein